MANTPRRLGFIEKFTLWKFSKMTHPIKLFTLLALLLVHNAKAQVLTPAESVKLFTEIQSKTGRMGIANINCILSHDPKLPAGDTIGYRDEKYASSIALPVKAVDDIEAAALFNCLLSDRLYDRKGEDTLSRKRLPTFTVVIFFRNKAKKDKVFAQLMIDTRSRRSVFYLLEGKDMKKYEVNLYQFYTVPFREIFMNYNLKCLG